MTRNERKAVRIVSQADKRVQVALMALYDALAGLSAGVVEVRRLQAIDEGRKLSFNDRVNKAFIEGEAALAKAEDDPHG